MDRNTHWKSTQIFLASLCLPSTRSQTGPVWKNCLHEERGSRGPCCSGGKVSCSRTSLCRLFRDKLKVLWLRLMTPLPTRVVEGEAHLLNVTAQEEHRFSVPRTGEADLFEESSWSFVSGPRMRCIVKRPQKKSPTYGRLLQSEPRFLLDNRNTLFVADWEGQ